MKKQIGCLDTHLNTESTVDLGVALVVFPDDTELENALRDLDDLKSLLVFRVRSQERLQTERQLIQSLLEFRFNWEDHRRLNDWFSEA